MREDARANLGGQERHVNTAADETKVDEPYRLVRHFE
jgi:hypothetical protein